MRKKTGGGRRVKRKGKDESTSNTLNVMSLKVYSVTNHALKGAVYNNFLQQAKARRGIHFIQEDLESHTHTVT